LRGQNLISEMFGTMKDAIPGVESPIQNRADFENLEMVSMQSGCGTIVGKIADHSQAEEA